MFALPIAKLRPVNKSGALADSVVHGSGLNNQGLRVRLFQEQAKGHDGAIKGRFVILDAGDNMHSQCLTALLHQATNAETVLELVRRQHPGCVNLVNANILVLDQG